MEAKDIIQLLRYQRHDLMNDLQIVHGYLSMGKIEKVKTKVNELLEAFNKERILMNSNCPNFVLWLIQLNWQCPTLRFTYNVDNKNGDMGQFDDLLTKVGKKIVEAIIAAKSDEMEVVRGELLVTGEDNFAELMVTLTGKAMDYEAFRKEMDIKWEHVVMQMEETDTSVVVRFQIPAL